MKIISPKRLLTNVFQTVRNGDIFANSSLDLPFARTKTLDPRVSFTRVGSAANAATYVGSDGLIKTAVTNLLLRSEEFGDASWTKANLTVTANAVIAPNGTLTADKLVENTANDQHIIYQSLSGTGRILSFYAKAAERTWVTIWGSGGGISRVNLTTGATGTVAPGAIIVTQNVGNGWYRISVTDTNASFQVIGVAQSDASISYTGDGTSGIYVWGAQLEQASTVGDYVPTGATINSAPRFDHNPTTGESLGLLVEEARTNNLTYSEDASQWLTPTNITLSQNQTVAPDGASTADQYLETVTNGLHVQSSPGFLFVTGTTYTYSVFVKSIGGRNFTIGYPPTLFTNRFARFTLSGSGFVQGSDAGVTADIQAYANGWYRCRATNTCVSGTGSRVDNFITDSSYSISYAGDVTKGLFIWGAQLEAGAFPTSYIPTTTATVTRAADVSQITGSNFSSFYNQTEGTVFAGWSSFAAATQRYIIDVEQAASANDRIDININTSNTVNPRTVVGGSAITSLSAGTYTANTSSNIGFGYKIADYGSSFNGAIPVTANTAGSLPSSPARLFIGSLTGTNYLNGTIRRLTFWPTRLSNTVLQQITQP
jgi:hypothetical protein